MYICVYTLTHVVLYHNKVHVGGDNCVHVKFKMRGISVELMDFQDEKKTGDTLTKF